MPETSFELRAAVARHPWPAVAIAFAVGAGLAFAERLRSMIVRAAGLAIGGALLSLVRERAALELARHARSWLDDITEQEFLETAHAARIHGPIARTMRAEVTLTVSLESLPGREWRLPLQRA